MFYTCPKCAKSVPVKENLFLNKANIPQIKGECPLCGSYLKFVKYEDSPLVKEILINFILKNGR